MYKTNRSEETDGIVTLLKEIAEGLGRLVSDHMKLIRLELLADANVYGRRLAMLAAFIPFVFLGYGIFCLGLAVVLSRWLGLGSALLLVGGMHAGVAAAGSFIALRKLHGVKLMPETAHAVGESASMLSASITRGTDPPAAWPERTASGARAIREQPQGELSIAESQP